MKWAQFKIATSAYFTVRAAVWGVTALLLARFSAAEVLSCFIYFIVLVAESVGSKTNLFLKSL